MTSKKQITTVRLYFRLLIVFLLCYVEYILSCLTFVVFLILFDFHYLPEMLRDLHLPFHSFFNINKIGSYLIGNNLTASVLSIICFGIILFVIHRMTKKQRTKKGLMSLMVVLLFSFPTIHKSERYYSHPKKDYINFQQAVRAEHYGLTVSPFGVSLFYFFTRLSDTHPSYVSIRPPKFEIELFANSYHYIGAIKPTPFLIVELVSLMSSIIAMVFIWRHFINKNKRLNKQKHQENG